MKKAISYRRVAVATIGSPEGSIYYQEMAIQEYCQQNEINLLHSFEDVGCNGSIMDRPSWKALEAFVQQHSRDIDFLIVKNLDRISRKAFLTATKVRELKTKYGIEVLSVTPVTRRFSELLNEFRTPEK